MLHVHTSSWSYANFYSITCYVTLWSACTCIIIHVPFIEEVTSHLLCSAIASNCLYCAWRRIHFLAPLNLVSIHVGALV